MLWVDRRRLVMARGGVVSGARGSGLQKLDSFSDW